ncbi:MAG: single-stranded DNA-binding protein, partial [Acidobacteriota bacterium]
IWFRVTFWDRLAEIAKQYLAKGRLVYIEGRLHAREWTDKDGRTRVSLDVRGTELQMLGGRGEETANDTGTMAAGAAAKGSPLKPTIDTIREDDIPF